jgi:thiol-disulfide isomerase/thioredoxin
MVVARRLFLGRYIFLLFLTLVCHGTKTSCYPATEHPSYAYKHAGSEQEESFVQERRLEKYDPYLYDKRDSVVTEIKSKVISKPRNSEIRVFYARWCPHCVVFAPKFKALANKAVADGFDVKFTAISCVELKSVCDEYNIKGYPAVRAFQFNSDTFSHGLTGKQLSHDEVSIRDYVLKYAEKLTSVMKQPLIDNSHENKVFESATVPENVKKWVHNTLRRDAREATPHERLHDALSSFEFMILEEGISALTEVKRTVLIRALRIVSFALPHGDFEFEQKKQMYSSISNEIAIANLKGVPDTIEHKYFKSKSVSTLKWTSCGIENGFTCGVWNLFHFITIAVDMNCNSLINSALREGNKDDFCNVAVIKSLFRDMVASFFPCEMCRDNFLKDYDSCSYDHCNLSRYDFAGLQLWFWKLHNSVTIRIFHEQLELSGGNTAHAGKVRDICLNIIWPSRQQCKNCYNQITYEKVIQFASLNNTVFARPYDGNELYLISSDKKILIFGGKYNIEYKRYNSIFLKI